MASPPSLSVLELFPWLIPLGFSTCGSSVTTNGCPAEHFGVKHAGMGQLLSSGSFPPCQPKLLIFRGWISFLGMDFARQLPGSCWGAARELYLPSLSDGEIKTPLKSPSGLVSRRAVGWHSGDALGGGILYNHGTAKVGKCFKMIPSNLVPEDTEHGLFPTYLLAWNLDAFPRFFGG